MAPLSSLLLRSEIASCIESSYDRLAVSAAMRKLFFDSERAMKNYAAERNWVLEGAAPHGPVRNNRYVLEVEC